MKFILFLTLFLASYTAFSQQQQFTKDSLQVEKLNAYANKIGKSDPTKTINTAKASLRLAEKINFEVGMAEAYRMMGNGYAGLGDDDVALSKFLLALNLFKKHNNLYGEAMAYNNIGNQYRFYDRKKALEFYGKCLKIAKRKKFEEIIAGCSINIASILIKEEKHTQALEYLNKSYSYFKMKKDSVTLALILNTQGFLFASLKKYNEAKVALNKCKELSLEKKLYLRIANSDLYLADIYINERNYSLAEKNLTEGLEIARKIRSKKLESDFLKEFYYLEKARKNYKEAVYYLQDLFRKDSVEFRKLVSKKYTLHQEQFDFIEKQKQTEILLEKQKTNRVIYISTVIVLILAFIVIALLVVQSRKKAKTLQKMKELNEEISIQKENLNKVNQNLESIIEERTQDLQVKNLKLSQYSSHLSHEIRSPISTIKGLLILDDEDLIDDQELIGEVKRCVEEIDHKLLNINQMLHNPQYKAFVLPEKKNGSADGTTTPPPQE